MATKIMIDAGHGGYDNGASYEGRLEKNDNLNLALALGDELTRRGYDVVYTRTEDVEPILRSAKHRREMRAEQIILYRFTATLHRRPTSIAECRPLSTIKAE